VLEKIHKGIFAKAILSVLSIMMFGKRQVLNSFVLDKWPEMILGYILLENF